MTAKQAERHSKNPELLAAFQLAVLGRLQSWDAQRDMERIIGTNFDGMDNEIASIGSGCAKTFTPDPADLEGFLLRIEEDK